MKHRLEISADVSLFTVITGGDGDAKGIIAFLDDIVSHPEWQAGKNILLDHRGLRIDQIQLAGIEEVSHYFKSISPILGNGKIALVMNREIDFGIARSWENMTTADVVIRIKVFREMEKALAWLGE